MPDRRCSTILWWKRAEIGIRPGDDSGASVEWRSAELRMETASDSKTHDRVVIN